MKRTTRVDWETSFKACEKGRTYVRPEPELEALTRRLEAPTREDVRVVTAALKDDFRKYFVASLASRTEALAEPFFTPMLDAAIDEVDPSFNRQFIEPCMIGFGALRVHTYLVDVLSSGPDPRTVGAENALYWAEGLFRSDEEAAACAAVLARADRRRLRIFVRNPNVDVRRSLIASLRLDESAYPPSHRPLVATAITIARTHEDEYIRHRAEMKLAPEETPRLFAALPHREKSAGPA